MLIYRSPQTRAWMMTRDGVSYFEWINGKWEPHQTDDECQAPDDAETAR